MHGLRQARRSVRRKRRVSCRSRLCVMPLLMLNAILSATARSRLSLPVGTGFGSPGLMIPKRWPC